MVNFPPVHCGLLQVVLKNVPDFLWLFVKLAMHSSNELRQSFIHSFPVDRYQVVLATIK